MSKKRPLEWKMDVVSTTSAAPKNGRISLGLRDNEIAEVHKIDSMISIGDLGEADDMVVGVKAVSMDPDIIRTPATPANAEDLEIFLNHEFGQEVEALGSSGLAAYSRKAEKEIHYYDPPILVGTDIGQVCVGDAVVAMTFSTRVFFTRRKANAQELNQILLKRR